LFDKVNCLVERFDKAIF